MTDPLRSARPAASADAPDRDRDARIEDLLLAGLDHYFAGQHELAINVWTRVLFLDRGHARARAYIERARGALSERQREGDELFHTAAAALHRGDRATARQLLTSAIDGASGEEALALLHRLDRLEVAAPQVEPAAQVGADTADSVFPRPHLSGRDGRLVWVAGGIAVGLLIAVLTGGYLWITADPFDLEARRPALPPVAEDPLPVPSPCELRLLQARRLFAQGQPHEALQLLEAGDPDERHGQAFDLLRATIQHQLLERGGQGAPPASAR